MASIASFPNFARMTNLKELELSSTEIIGSGMEHLEGMTRLENLDLRKIEVTGADTASGIWSMYDRVELPGAAFEGWGHYHEDYRRVEGQWRIARIVLTRLRVSPLELD